MPPKRRKLLGRRTAAARAARASETPEQTSLCLSRMDSSSDPRLSTESAAARTESPAHTTVRRVRNARSTASARALETPAQTTVRRVGNTRFTVSARVLENPAQTTFRSVRNARSTARGVQIGVKNKVCTFCNAKKWAGEQPGRCCSGGKIKLPSLDEPPQPLRDLLLGTTSNSTHFLEAIRKYNCCFQMTSFGAKAISEGGWIPTFKVQGHVYHLMGSLLADQGEPPQFLQIYFLADYNEQGDAHFSILPSDFSVGPRRDILFSLQDTLHETNSYIRSLKFALQKNSSPSFSVVNDADRRPDGEHERRFNAPACNDVAEVIQGKEHNSRDIVISYRGGGLRRISETHRSYDCLQYPLLFPYGSDGYHFKIPICQASSDSMSTSKTVSCRAYYAYIFMVREGEFNHLHRCRQLFLQFAVDMAAKIESEKLGFIKLNQSKLRTDSCIHLRDGLRSDGDPCNLDKPCILPSSYTDGPLYMHEKTKDTMTYAPLYERPDFFVTFTCNPKWAEITREFFPRQQYSHRSDLIARVFRLQLCKLMDLILKGQVF
ncbi:unnamed protein product [Acanthosepion pharaonis]|uniref:Helitron helicase-like domain-containing protein n=1 Tax=Acanthosepion pharaonis TaxID=158019 RepID=A0A812ES65_ACAPH|nr:unnamed protein product [Sepia pharaonis]